jgi:cytochrome P450
MTVQSSPPPLVSAPGPSPRELLRLLPGLRDNPLAFLQQTAERYGELAQIKLGPLNAFVLTGPADIQRVLQDNNRNYTKDTIQYNSLAEVTGQGLLTSDGETWLRHRRQLQPAFHRQRIQAFGPTVVEAATRLADGWQSKGEERIDLDRAMMALALEILGKALLGVDLRRDAPELTSAVLVALDHVVNGLKSPNPLPGFIPTPERRRFKEALRRLDRAAQEIIQAQRGAAHPASLTGGTLMDALLCPAEGEAGMSDRQVRDELITMLIAGHETVASALTWACYLLAQNPAAEQRLRNELVQVSGGRSPSVEDLPALEYTRRVFDEALRLYPPAWLVTRKNIEEDTLSGVRIPPGSLVVIAIAAAQRSPIYWPDPLRFDPDRFLPEAANARPRYAYLPFGGGPRLCIGSHFALMEAPLILATLYQRFHFELEGSEAVIVDPLVTLRPRGGLPMFVKSLI